VIEGDVLVDEELMLLTEKSSVSLLGITDKGKIVRWSTAVSTNIRYFFDPAFPVDKLLLLRPALKSAGDDWAKVCGVEFSEVLVRDQAVFTVVYCGVGLHGLLALAFFPADVDRTLRVYDACFEENGFPLVGVMRHELGHVLGFKHEHIRNPFIGGESLNDTIGLTSYESVSVMHYVVGRLGNANFIITAQDGEGARRVYGYPVAGFEMIE
jgi:hypothetical protein